MIKASALYMAIIIALVIAALCAAMMAAAYYYRINHQAKFSFDRLHLNLNSALNLSQTDSAGTDGKWKYPALYGSAEDPVRYQRFSWGAYDIGTAESFNNRDTLRYTVSFGRQIDSGNRTALYVSDEDRPVSVSGKTFIGGDAYLPKAGIREAYLDSKGYEGDKALVTGGKKKTSQRELPALNPGRIGKIEQYLNGDFTDYPAFPSGDSVINSFSKPTLYLSFGKAPVTLHGKHFRGNIMILSDTTLTIDSTNRFENIIVAARALIVEPGFQGTCQLFATDSLHVGAGSRMGYPSAIGILNRKKDAQPKISIGQGTVINGIVFLWQKDPSMLLPVIQTGAETVVNGEVFTPGLLLYKGKLTINGSIFARRFLYQSAFTSYENYLINIRIDNRGRSPYYLTGMLANAGRTRIKILQWLEKR